MLPLQPDTTMPERRAAPVQAQADAGPARGSRSALGRLGDLILTDDRRQRRFLKILLSNAMVYIMSIAMMVFGSRHGLFPPQPVLVLSMVMTFTVLAFFFIFRSGLNTRFADPSLSVPHCLAAHTLIAWSYAVTGPAHAGALVLFPVVSIFGMFDHNPRHARLVNGYAVAAAGLVMFWRSYTSPEIYQRDLQLIYFLLLSVSQIAITQVSMQLSIMRGRLKTQKVALEQALGHIQQMATHDDLTGLANRRHVLTLLEEHAMRHARGGPTFYVAIADLDFFKRINDNHGHGVGDEALCTFARQAKAQLRTTDVIGRWGGEEFLVLLPETPPGDPNVGLERLRRSLADTPASDSVQDLRVAFSAGLSRYRDGEAVGDTVDRADRALYAAKAAGRNCTVAL